MLLEAAEYAQPLYGHTSKQQHGGAVLADLGGRSIPASTLFAGRT
jgi:hypothetical protein